MLLPETSSEIMAASMRAASYPFDIGPLAQPLENPLQGAILYGKLARSINKDRGTRLCSISKVPQILGQPAPGSIIKRNLALFPPFAFHLDVAIAWVHMRIANSELCKLTIGNTHMDPRDSYIKVEGKGRKQREVPLDDRTRRRLAKYLRHFRDGAKPGAPVFVDRTGKLPIKNSALERIFQRLGEWANIEGVRCSPHTCRHYFAARFWQQHQDIYALSRILGHASVGVTEDYLRSLSGVDVRIALQQR